MRESTAWRILAEEHDAGATSSNFLCTALRNSGSRTSNQRMARITEALALRMVRRIISAVGSAFCSAYEYDSGTFMELRQARVLACLMFAEMAKDEERVNREDEEVIEGSASGVDQERSTARTEAPASNPVRGKMSDRVEEIRSRLKDVTRGPWYVWDGHGYFGGGRDLCIGAGLTWLANMDHRICDKRSEHMVALEIAHGNVKCEPEIDSAILSIAETCKNEEKFTAEQEANANFIARVRVIADLQDEMEHTEWQRLRKKYGTDIAGPEPEPRRWNIAQ